jgi:TonB family protein
MHFMLDSTAAHQRGIDLPSISVVNEDRASAEHASALLKMGALKQEAGEYAEAEDLFRRALEIGERSLDPKSPALVPAMMSLAAARIMCGKFEDAEPLVFRALALSENGLAERDPDFVTLLNDVTRLSLKQSAHVVAEPLLLRLLEIKRSKGEDHPEVATVLASLATVRQALGRHESAEQLWRRVLEIRERTLAPNHFAVATALEHLAEACAARGKLGEALELFKRAQTIRELTLGAGHSSLRVSRDRIADLQLQAAEDSLDSLTVETPPPAPERYRLLAADNSVVSSARQAKPRSVGKQWKGTAPAIERDTSKNETASLPASVLPVADVTPADAHPSRPDPTPYLDVLLSINQELAEEEKADSVSHRAKELLGTVAAKLKQRQKATAIGVATVILVAALALVPRVWSGAPRAAIAEEVSPYPALSSVAEPSAPEASSASTVLPVDATKATVAGNSAASPIISSFRARFGERRSPAKSRSEESAQISIPNVVSPQTAGLDSVVRARGAASSGVSETFAVLPPPVSGGSQPLTFERAEPVSEPQPARLIGTLPTPRTPAQVAGVEGDVRVRFDVDASGRPVMSSVSVLQSPNVLLTAAVLKVIPGLRFDPARSGGAEPKPVGDVVQLRFQFRPTK